MQQLARYYRSCQDSCQDFHVPTKVLAQICKNRITELVWWLWRSSLRRRRTAHSGIVVPSATSVTLNSRRATVLGMRVAELTTKSGKEGYWECCGQILRSAIESVPLRQVLFCQIMGSILNYFLFRLNCQSQCPCLPCPV